MEETKFSFLLKRIGEKDYEDIKKAAFVLFYRRFCNIWNCIYVDLLL